MRSEPEQSTGLAADLPDSWRAALETELQQPYFKALDAFVASERASGTVFPPRALTFAAANRD